MAYIPLYICIYILCVLCEKKFYICPAMDYYVPDCWVGCLFGSPDSCTLWMKYIFHTHFPILIMTLYCALCASIAEFTITQADLDGDLSHKIHSIVCQTLVNNELFHLARKHCMFSFSFFWGCLVTLHCTLLFCVIFFCSFRARCRFDSWCWWCWILHSLPHNLDLNRTMNDVAFH